jgi:hypothetical protein
MDLPRELRDEICTGVLLTPTAPPDINQSFDTLIESRVMYKNPKLRAWTRGVIYDPKNTTTTVPSLVLVNKQLHDEALSILNRLSKHPTYEMDLIIADEVLLLPTWTLLLHQRTTAVDTVNVNFRIAGIHDKKKTYPSQFYGGFVYGDGGGPAMKWQLYAVLERFIRVGTGGKIEHTDTHLHVTAKTVRINVQTPPLEEGLQFGPPKSGYRRRRETGLGGDVLDPAYLVQFVRNQLTGLLKPQASHEWFQYGTILYEHVDEVVVCKDGVEMMREDVAECLKGTFIVDRYFSAEDMREYKRNTWKLRKSRGLKVVDD